MLDWITYILFAVVVVLVVIIVITSFKHKTEPNKQYLSRVLWLTYGIFIALFCVVIVKIVDLQYVQGDKYRALRNTTKVSPKPIYAQRGNILSRDGRLLSGSMPYYTLYMDMRVEALKVENKNKIKYFDLFVKDLADSLSNKFKDKSAAAYEKELRRAFKRQKSEHKLYKHAVSHLDLLQIKNFPILKRGSIQGGFTVKERMRREYPYNTLALRTIGNLYEQDKRGAYGLELYYDSILRGENGEKIEKKIAGRKTTIITKEPIDGQDITSTIDIDIQEVAEKSLLEQLKETDASSGIVVLMETKTGCIRAISNFEKDPKTGQYKERHNLAVAAQIDPGSTFKTMSMLVALEDGVIDTTTRVNTFDGSYVFADRRMRDWNYKGPNGDGGFGIASVPEVFYQSSNVGVSYLIEQHYGKKPQKFIDGIKKTGFLTPIKLEIPGHGKVVIKTPGKKNWYGTTLPWMSIGYEVQVPPIYTLMFYNAIANGGTMVKPRFVERFSIHGKTAKETQTEVIKDKICSDKTLGKLQAMLLGVVEKGTGKGVKSELFSIAGKTGTSQIFEKGTNKDKDGKVRHQITFCGYFPAENPMYSCVVYVREPKKGGAGTVCGKVFRDVAEKAYIKSGGERKETENKH